MNRRTTYKMKRADAEQQFPGAEPDLQSREVRMRCRTPAS